MTIALDPEYEAFLIYVAVFSVDSSDEMHPSKRAQIAHLKVDKTPSKVPTEYADFVDIFLPKLATELLEHTKINNHAIKLVDDQQPPYSPIYSLGFVELETLNAYIENNLINGLIKPFKSPAGALIFFIKKADGSLRLYVDYRGLNNLTIRNWYLLSLVGESLDWLGWVRRFTQLNLIIVYHQMRIRKGNE